MTHQETIGGGRRPLNRNRPDWGRIRPGYTAAVRTTTRRQFLALVGAVAATTGLPEQVVAETLAAGVPGAAAAAALTTLGERLRAGAPTASGWRPVVTGAGEPHLPREELVKAQPGRQERRATLQHFAHLTDQHIVDCQSPARVEFTDRFAGGACSSSPVGGAWRPHEAAAARITEAMVRRLRAVAVSPVSGTPIVAAVCTGDNTDNQQANELATFLAAMDGGPVAPNSGDPNRYEGVQASGNPDYWHPDPAMPDRYKDELGFPARAGFLEDALAPFEATGIGVPWYSCYGNHDGLVQGNSPPLAPFVAVAVGGAKPTGAPPGTDPCAAGLPIGRPGAPVMTVTPDPARRFISRREWMEGHLSSPGLPAGHGFTAGNVTSGTAYYARDVGSLRWIVLDTVNPGGFAEGSIGDQQLAWLDAELSGCDQRGQLAILFSHHGLRSMTNPFQEPDPTQDPSASDLPRHMADDVEAVLAAHPSVIAWVNGHTHDNVIESRQDRWWDIGTAAHIDWPAQSRLVEVVDNRDGTLSIFTTIVDHEGGGLVGFARELSGNDPQHGFAKGNGDASDRNAELLLVHPFAAGADPGAAEPPRVEPAPAPAPMLPATGLPAGITVGGALALAGSMGLLELRRRATTAPRPGRPPR